MLESPQGVFYALALTLCVFSCLVVKGDEKSSFRAPFFFSIYLLLEATGFAFEFLAQSPGLPLGALFLGLLMVSSFLVAPCLYLLGRELTEASRPVLPSLLSKHGLVIIAGSIFTLPLLHSVYVNSLAPAGTTPIGSAHSLVIHTTMLISIAIFSFQVPYYLVKTRKLVVPMQSDNLSKKTLNIMNLLMLLVVTNWLMSLCRAFNCMFIKTDGLLFAAIEVAVTVWVLVLIIRRSPNAFVQEETTEALLNKTPLQSKYARSGLEAQQHKRIADKLLYAMEKQQVYIDSMLTLQRLSAQIGEKSHHVSQVINQSFHCNFFDWVNRYRITHAQNMLLSQPNITILEVAMACGFNAKSTFNTAFKKATSQTPSEFRQLNKNTEFVVQ
ncbi:AraC family transcriptional regulator [Aliiglaciecola sp. M165]|uniref:helix-turn-helix domain-containing protein n=1 Tax=Aliiglaciecola sp. M165 TaxID=2593649 RepID=UPI00117E350C|nr:AraC family transcriptional regulator [Aliiglaciecola sp. M165]TRY33993.1 helix-turn-helix transcriptional regulator [Aliiglaciecola sp. M165]